LGCGCCFNHQPLADCLVRAFCNDSGAYNICSSNILLGSHYEAKIADFGLARECTGGTTAGQFTHATVQHQANLYKLHAYLPKEFHMGNQKYSVTTDIYSFGVVSFR
jgi:serine/threonine protein kinase